MNFKQAALQYAKKGWAVFPLKPKTKEPATAHGFKDATTDASQIETWWNSNPNYNVGVATGEVSGVWVLDLDGSDGIAQWDKQQLNWGIEVKTLSAKTGGGGKHLFFKHVGVKIKNRTNLLPNVDIRGDGGYVVVAPSVHPNGNVYEWLTNV
jgi:hypothetical protein